MAIIHQDSAFVHSEKNRMQKLKVRFGRYDFLTRLFTSLIIHVNSKCGCTERSGSFSSFVSRLFFFPSLLRVVGNNTSIIA